MLRALDWVPASISALLETCMRRLFRLVESGGGVDEEQNRTGAKRAQFRLGSTPIVCKNRWECALRFYVDSRAAADASIEHWHPIVSEDGSKFGRAPPSARRDVRPAPKLRPGDG